MKLRPKLKVVRKKTDDEERVNAKMSRETTSTPMTLMSTPEKIFERQNRRELNLNYFIMCFDDAANADQWLLNKGNDFRPTMAITKTAKKEKKSRNDRKMSDSKMNAKKIAKNFSFSFSLLLSFVAHSKLIVGNDIEWATARRGWECDKNRIETNRNCWKQSLVRI